VWLIFECVSIGITYCRHDKDSHNVHDITTIKINFKASENPLTACGFTGMNVIEMS